MQSGFELYFLGVILIIAGVLFIFLGSSFMFKSSSKESTSHQSKGVILLGPIPIVWGFGKRGKILAISLFIIVLAIWIILYFP